MLNGIEDIEGLTPEQIEAINGLATPLISKRDELLEKLNKTKQQSTENQSAAEKLAAMQALQEQKELEDKQNYEEALSMVQSKSQKEIEKLTELVSGYETERKNNLIGGSIQDALTDARVNPLHMEYVSTYFKQQAKIDDGKVIIGNQSLSDAIKEWAETDSGKAVRLAPDNSGGNANGGTQTSGSGNKMTDAEKRAADINKRLGM